MRTYVELAQNLPAIEKMAEWIAKSGMFGCSLDVQANIIACDVFITDTPLIEYQKRNMLVGGRPAIPYDAMIAAFQESGGKIKVVEKSPAAARVELTFDGATTPFALTWEEAQQEPFVYAGKEKDIVAQLSRGEKPRLKDKYATPRSRAVMLYARVISDGIRTVAAKCNFGCYTPEEIDDIPVNSSSGNVTSAPGSAPVVTQATSAPAAATASITPVASASATTQATTQAAATASASTTAPAVATQTGVGLNEKATEVQRQKVVDLIKEVAQMGQPDIADRVRNKLQSAGITGGILGLTVQEADQLINALSVRNIEAWCDMALKGYTASQPGNV